MPENLVVRAGRPWLSSVGTYLAITIFAVCLISLAVRAHPQLSVIDEFQHSDYLFKVDSGRLVRTGDLVGAQAMHEVACRGLDVTFSLPACDSTRDPSAYPGGGFNTADIHPPLYYAVTDVFARALLAVHLAPDLFTAARLVGGLWLAAALVLTWMLAGDLGATIPARVCATVLVGVSPAVLYLGSVINPDITALVGGALVTLVSIRWEQRRMPLWLVPLAGAAAVTLRATSLLMILAMALYLGLRILGPGADAANHRRRRWENIVAAGLLLGGTGAAELAWLWARHSMAIASAANSQVSHTYHAAGLHASQVISQVTVLVMPVDWASPFLVQHGPFIWGQFRKPALMAGVHLFSWLLIGAVLGAVFFLPRWRRVNSLALALAALLLLGGPFLVVIDFLAEQAFFDIQTRYGLGLLPALAAVLAVALRPRRVWIGAAALSAGALAITLDALLRAPLA